MIDFKHVSVLLSEAVDGLNIKSDGIYVDGTTGGGGHSLEIVKALGSGRLICIDRDADALKAAKERLREYLDKVTFVKDNYKNLPAILKSLGVDGIDGCLFDLGVSSFQLDEKMRGFSYMEEDAPLDMRMDTDSDFSAKDILNSYEKEELIRIFKEYGEERYASRIADNIIKIRQTKPFETTKDLNSVIAKSVPANQKGGHPSKRVFQALRIEVNEELSGIYDFFYELPQILNDKGRICVITFHSLEDRAVKQAFKKLTDPCICPKEFPVCTCNRKPMGRTVTRKPILPTSEEIEQNKRSKSAKLRIFEVQK